MHPPRARLAGLWAGVLALVPAPRTQEPADPPAPEPAEAAAPAAGDAAAPAITKRTLSAFRLRGIGPAITSGRIGDLAIDPTDPRHWYVAVASGGVWETHNAGTTWRPVFDGQKSFSIGCIAIDPHDPLTVWVGTGENNSQRSVSYGDGVYKSTDGGRTWHHKGLAASEHIGRILVDPREKDRVFVAAQGPLWSAGGDRGLYLSEDGGATWKCVLAVDEHTGVSEVVADAGDPDLLLASSYQRRRHVWTLINGGPGSGIHRSTDGGRSWQKVTRGLPGGDLGRIGLAMAGSRPGLCYAIVEAQEDRGGFFRSTDGGASWHKRSGYVSGSPQYYQELFVDPHDPDRVYSMDVLLRVSDDGGANWRVAGEDDKHVDNHALWIDPEDPRHLLVGTDGGLYETFDQCATWRFFANLPVTQFYRITADEDFPFYNVYGGTQDNFSLGAPARTTSASGITNGDWFVTRGGDGFETVVDPTDPDVLYAQSQHGGLVRYDRRTGETVGIQPLEEPGDEPLRWNWNAPLILSPHANTRLYFAANCVFRSDDRGDTWQRVGGDLTRGTDRDRLEVMGRVWGPDAVSKNRSTSIYGNVVALSESPLQEGRLWAGTDDGLVQVTDGGGAWTRIDGFPGVPAETYVSCVLASLHDADTVYAAFDNHKRGDFEPYLMRSEDRGATWTDVAGDLPRRGSVHTVVEDHVDPRLLFCGTEFGLFCTLDGGGHWLPLEGGLPPIAVRDLEIQRRENDLVVGTFGRGIYVLDDYAPMRALTPEVLAEPACVLPVARAWQFVESRPLGGRGRGFRGASFFTAPNPPVGAVFTWHLGTELKTRKQRRQAAEAAARKEERPIDYPDWDQLRAEDREVAPRVWLVVRDASAGVVCRVEAPAGKGLHRTVWDLRCDAPGRGRGPLAPPGTYTVAVATQQDGEWRELTAPREFEVALLPGARFPAEDPAADLAFAREAAAFGQRVQAAVAAAEEALRRLDDVDRTLPALPAAEPEWFARAHGLRERLLDLQQQLEGDPTLGRRHAAEPPSLRQRARAAGASTGSRSAPTGTQRMALRTGQELLGRLLPALRQVCEEELTAFERQIEAAGGPPPRGRLPGR